MKNINWIIKIGFFIMLFGCILSCEQMDDSYCEFLEGGEIIYTSKVDSLQAFGGHNRALIKYQIISDPKIVNSRIYWNDGTDSLDIPLQRSTGIDKISGVITDLPEGIYTFNVYTYDKDKNRSIKSEIICSVYGEVYAGSISNRPLKSAIYNNTTGNVMLEWYGVSEQAVIVTVVYTDKGGNSRTLVDVPTIDPLNPAKSAKFKVTTIVPNFKQGSALEYKTGYKPTSTAIDTFFTAPDTVIPL
jgi:hypothetical protein